MLFCVVEPHAFDTVVSEALGVANVQESKERLQRATEDEVAAYLRTHAMPPSGDVDVADVDEGTPLLELVTTTLAKCHDCIAEKEDEASPHALLLVVSGARPPIGAGETWADVARKVAAVQQQASIMVYLVVDRVEEELRDEVDRVALAFQGIAAELGVDAATADLDASVQEAVATVCHRFLRPAEAILALGHVQAPVTLMPNPHLGWHRARGFADSRDVGETRVPAVLPILAFLPNDAVLTPPAVTRHSVASLPRATAVATQAGGVTLMGMLNLVMATEKVTALLRLDKDAYALLDVVRDDDTGRFDATLHILEPGTFLPWLPPVSNLVLRADMAKVRGEDEAVELAHLAKRTAWNADDGLSSTSTPVFSAANVQAALSLVRRLGDKLPLRKERLVGVVKYLHEVASVYGIASLSERVVKDLTASMAVVVAAGGSAADEAYAVVDPLAALVGGKIDRAAVDDAVKAQAQATPSRKKKKRPRESDADEEDAPKAAKAAPASTSKRSRAIKRPKRLENGANLDDVDDEVVTRPS